jgi:hypothetical protein
VRSFDLHAAADSLCDVLDHRIGDRAWLTRCAPLDGHPNAIYASSVMLRVVLRHLPDGSTSAVVDRVVTSLAADDAEVAAFRSTFLYLVSEPPPLPSEHAPPVVLRITVASIDAAVSVIAPRRRARRRLLLALRDSLHLAAGVDPSRFEQAWSVMFDPAGVDPLRSHLAVVAHELHGARCRLNVSRVPRNTEPLSGAQLELDAGVMTAADAARIVAGSRAVDPLAAQRVAAGVIALWAAGADVGAAAHHAAEVEALLAQ